MSTRVPVVVLTVAAVLLGGMPFYASAQSAKPTVTITTVPSYFPPGGREKMEPIAGTVTGAPRGTRIVLFAHTNAWYVQPYVKAPFTEIADGKWQNSTFLGSEYAALLVTAAYKPPDGEMLVLPAIGADVLAIARVPGKR